jgi:hypothetical protein
MLLLGMSQFMTCVDPTRPTCFLVFAQLSPNGSLKIYQYPRRYPILSLVEGKLAPRVLESFTNRLLGLAGKATAIPYDYKVTEPWHGIIKDQLKYVFMTHIFGVKMADEFSVLVQQECKSFVRQLVITIECMGVTTIGVYGVKPLICVVVKQLSCVVAELRVQTRQRIAFSEDDVTTVAALYFPINELLVRSDKHRASLTLTVIIAKTTWEQRFLSCK